LLAQPEAGPEHPVLGIALARPLPLLEPLGECRQLQRIGAHDRICARQRGKPGVDGRKRAPRAAAAPTPGELRRQKAPRARVHHGPQQIAKHRLGRIALLGEHELRADERRHRGDQHPHSLRVVGVDRHRPPAGDPPLVTPRQPRKHPAARHELERELACLGQEPQRVAERETRRRRRGQREQRLERRGRRELDRRSDPRVKQLRIAGTEIFA
jgi:hypothetical protein